MKTANLQARPSKFNVTMELIPGSDLPEDFINFRRAIYHSETQLLAEDNIIDENDRLGTHIVLRDEFNKIIGAVCLVEAERSNFPRYSKVPEKLLSNSFYATRASVSPDRRSEGLFSLLMYLLCRHVRMAGRAEFISYLEERVNLPAKKILPWVEVSNAQERAVKDAQGKTYRLHAISCDVDHTMSKTFYRLSPQVQNWIADSLMLDEIRKRVELGLERFYNGSFCRSVFSGTLTKSQYINVMANNHQFVRWTTRLVAKAVSDCSNREIRKSLLDHLNGEIDHEVWIENDLDHLGADTSYIVNEMVPNIFIHQFMTVQESTIHFTRDTTKFLGIPIAIEAITAFMPFEFIEELKKNIESWGIKSPAKACTFLASHIHTDGGERGHWQSTLKSLGSILRTEKDLRWILNLIDMVFDSVTRGYDICVEQPALDSAHSTDQLAGASRLAALSKIQPEITL